MSNSGLRTIPGPRGALFRREWATVRAEARLTQSDRGPERPDLSFAQRKEHLQAKRYASRASPRKSAHVFRQSLKAQTETEKSKHTGGSGRPPNTPTGQGPGPSGPGREQQASRSAVARLSRGRAHFPTDLSS